MSYQLFQDIIKTHIEEPTLEQEETIEKNTEESQTFNIIKTDEDKRLIFGWASVAIRVDGEQVIDHQNDLIDPEDLEEAVYEYVLNFRDSGEEHIGTLRKKAKMVESCIFTKEKMQAMGIPEGIVPEGWWIGFYVEDDEAWKKVKSGIYQMFSIEGQGIREEVQDDIDKSDRINGCGVLVVKDGKILTGTRIDGKHKNQICGPGGHIEHGEEPEEAAIREASEEFGIECKALEPLGILDGGRSYGKSAIFLCTEYDGEPETDEEEMTDCKWRTLEELAELKLFKPFEQSLVFFEEEDEIEKANPYHDELGRFTSKNGGGGATFNRPYNQIEAQALEQPSMAASYLLNEGADFNEVMSAFQDGTVTAKAKESIDKKYKELKDRYDNASEGQKKLMRMTPEEASEFIKESKDAEIPSNLNAGSTTQRVIHQLGMHEKPTVLSREEYEEVVKESPSGKIYRGVRENGNVGVTADEIAEMTVKGDQTFLGYGMHSDGIYFSTDSDTASHFSGQNGVAFEGCISPKARVVDYDALGLERAKDPQGYTITDTGTYALYKGYNAIKVKASSNEDYYIALDRTAMVFPNDYKAQHIIKPKQVIHLELEKAMKEINGEELGKVFNEFVFKEKSPQKRPSVAKSFDEILEEGIQKFNPFHDARGRFASSNGFASYSANPKSKAGAMAISRSAQAGHGKTMNVHRESQGENIDQNYRWMNGGPGAKQLSAQGQLASQQPKKNYDKLGFADHDDADFHQLYNGRQYYQQQKLTTAQQKASANYLESQPEPGSLYSHSQNMNWQMANGQTLTGKYKQTHDGLMSAMHNLGYNVELSRYDHDGMVNGLLNAVGAKGSMDTMSISQMKKALVGATVQENKFLSVSYNDFKNAPQQSKNVFMNRMVKITYKAKAGTQAMMPGNGPGGNLGELILAPTNGKNNPGGKIVDVKYSGNKARRKGTQTLNQKQVEIVIEI